MYITSLSSSDTSFKLHTNYHRPSKCLRKPSVASQAFTSGKPEPSTLEGGGGDAAPCNMGDRKGAG